MFFEEINLFLNRNLFRAYTPQKQTMEFRDLIQFFLLIVVFQVGSGVVLFVFAGGGTGIDFYSIGLSIIVLIIVSSGIGMVLYWLVRRYMKERAIRTAMMAMTEDEQEILRIIMEEGMIRQDDLRREVDFSKSKVSALVNNLVDKNAIEKTRYKRTNRLKPTEQFQK